MRLGILPAAGRAERWGGYPKELLPISRTDTFLSRAVRSLQMSGCDYVVVITNPSKIHLHSFHLRDWRRVLFEIQQGEEMWAAMATAIEIPAEEYFFLMPDTYVPSKPFPASLDTEFAVGLFHTDEPERFGTLRGDKFVNKQPSELPCLAWGALAWNRSVAKHWKARSIDNYTDAINDAIRVFGFSQWRLPYYFDIGTFKHYREFLLAQRAVSGIPAPLSGLTEVPAQAEQQASMKMSTETDSPSSPGQARRVGDSLVTYSGEYRE